MKKGTPVNPLPEMKVIKRTETLKLHYHPDSIKSNLELIIDDAKKDGETPKDLVNLFEDALLLVKYAISHIQPEPKSEA